ncbi:putative DNA-binding protein [Stutzerimonas stutzeri CCUG 29243]|uniref:Putative DNA-binding protein n=1 Tax=Stutzerimonas stutzeri CCUG 29243 TaxID=1196835 RepID=I4CUG7_STUST|nr:putative DNA-binding protein [Stutzerimonas stutzeri CCUG 29243]
MSQDVFVQAIQAKPATLKNWEQNRSKPNHQITVLIRILSRHPEHIRELA